eukprot:384859_1
MGNKLGKHKSKLNRKPKNDQKVAKNDNIEYKTNANEHVSNQQSCLHDFTPNDATVEISEWFQKLMETDIISTIFIKYLSIYTLFNLTCALQIKISSMSIYSKVIKQISEAEKTIDYKKQLERVVSHHWSSKVIATKREIYLKNTQSILGYMAKNAKLYNKTERIIEYGNTYEEGDVGYEYDVHDSDDWSTRRQLTVKFNRTDIYDINHLLKLYISLMSNLSSIEKDFDQLIDILDQLVLDDIVDYEMNRNTIMFIYLFLSIILSLDGSKQTIYSSMSKLYECGDDSNIWNVEKHETKTSVLIFKNNQSGELNQVYLSEKTSGYHILNLPLLPLHRWNIY